MESVDEVHNHGGSGEYPPAVVKGKRTKRRRQPSPAAGATTMSSSSASSSESTTTEEEDMANCLILLAQGAALDQLPWPPKPESPPEKVSRLASPPSPSRPPPPSPPPVTASTGRSERYTSRKYTEAAATADGGKAGFYVYECKTCNKCFPSFQALGGHRASHKKPRIAEEAKKPSPSSSPPSDAGVAVDALHVGAGSSSAPPKLPAVMAAANGNKIRVHECSICGAEFTSGQALGGHMRRHRPLSTPELAAASEIKKERVVNLELDLNLPAPSDADCTDFATSTTSTSPPPAFSFDGKQALVLSASPLVDCHY